MYSFPPIPLPFIVPPVHRLTRWALLLASSLALCGCLGLKDHSHSSAVALSANQLETKISLADTRVSALSWPPEQWWQSFKDPQLEQLIEEALQKNPSLKIAEARVNKANAYVQSIQSISRSQIQVAGQITQERFSGKGSIPPPFAGSKNTAAGLQSNLNLDPDFWGKNLALYQSALDQSHAIQMDVLSAKLALCVQITGTYLQFAQAHQELDLARHSLILQQDILALSKARWEAGIDSELVLKPIESSIAQWRRQMAQYAQLIDLYAHQLAALVGVGPDRTANLKVPHLTFTTSLEIPSQIPAELLGRRPDILALRWRIEAAQNEVTAAKKLFYPNVNLNAFLGFQSIGLPGFLQNRSLTYGAGPAVTLPIFDGGRIRANLSDRQADLDIWVEQYNEAVINALREVVDQLSAFRHLTEAIKQLQVSYQATDATRHLAQIRFQEGIGNQLEVFNIQTQLLNQQFTQLELATQQAQLSVNLARALGGGFETNKAALVPQASSPSSP